MFLPSSLAGAATACYLSGGDFLDSSLYDNCDGTPRYADQGFVEWLHDLQGQRALIRKNIIDGTFEEQEQVRKQVEERNWLAPGLFSSCDIVCSFIIVLVGLCFILLFFDDFSLKTITRCWKSCRRLATRAN